MAGGFAPGTRTVVRNGLPVRQSLVTARPRRVIPNEATVTDPAQLARHLQDVLQEASDATLAARANPMTGANVFTVVVGIAQNLQLIAHGLKRAYQRWGVCRPRPLLPSPPSGLVNKWGVEGIYEVPLGVTVYGTMGMTTDRTLALWFPNAGTFDVEVS